MKIGDFYCSWLWKPELWDWNVSQNNFRDFFHNFRRDGWLFSPCSHKEMMGSVRKENFLLPDVTPCLYESNFTLDSVGLCPQLAVLPARPRAPVIPCRTFFSVAQAMAAMYTRVCQICNMGHFSLPADFLCCFNLLQKVRDILSSTEKLKANKKSISSFWNPSAACIKKIQHTRKLWQCYAGRQRLRQDIPVKRNRKGEPPAVKIILQQRWGIALCALYSIYVHVLSTGLRSYRLPLCSWARISCSLS